jgi:hypothetical protein
VVVVVGCSSTVLGRCASWSRRVQKKLEIGKRYFPIQLAHMAFATGVFLPRPPKRS